MGALREAGFGALIGLSRSVKRLIQIGVDCTLMALCLALAVALRLDAFSPLANPSVWIVLLPVVPLTVLTFSLLGLYSAVIRFLAFDALIAVLAGVFVSAAVMFAAAQMLDLPLPRSVPGIYALLLSVSAGGVRFSLRALLSGARQHLEVPVLIYGAGSAGRQLAEALRHGREYEPVAFADDDPRLQRLRIAGLKVHPPVAVPDLVKVHGVRVVLLAMPSVGRRRRREIVESLADSPVEVMVTPGIADIVSGRAQFSDLRRVEPEDLLGRDPVPPREKLMAANVTGKSVLVSGAGGSIGSEICRQALAFAPRSLVLFERSEHALYMIEQELRRLTAAMGPRAPLIVPVLGSVLNPTLAARTLRSHAVDTVYHAAAYKHVPLLEENEAEGVHNNVFGTRTLALAAREAGVRAFILVSTDKAVRPANVMGASKRMAELICQTLAEGAGDTVFSIVRFGNVLGSSGSVIPLFRAQIEHGGPVTVTHRDITRYFMTIPEAAQLVIQAGALARGGEVFLLDMGQPVRILELAETMVRLHGLVPYLPENGAPVAAARGDIAIRIVGLRRGEKLHEELLLGNDPRPTEHPRIMTGRETVMQKGALMSCLESLASACSRQDGAAIRRILAEAPTGYRPESEGALLRLAGE